MTRLTDDKLASRLSELPHLKGSSPRAEEIEDHPVKHLVCKHGVLSSDIDRTHTGWILNHIAAGGTNTGECLVLTAQTA